MAGRAHHFIPQLLLRGFSTSRTAGGQEQVGMYRRGHQPVLTAIKNVAKKRDFYGQPDSELDDLITFHEGQIADSVRRYRRATGSCQLGNDEYAVDLIVLTSVRTRWIRASFERLITEALDRFNGIVEQHGEVSFLINYIDQNPDWWIDNVRQALASRIGRQDASFVKTFASGLRDMLGTGGLSLSQGRDNNSIQQLLALIRAIVPDICRRGHIKGIRRLFEESGWRENISSWEWRLQQQDSGPYMLGDFGPLFVSSSDDVGPIGVNAGEMAGVVMAISSQTLLVGGEVSDDMWLAPEGFNRLTAEWSVETIVCDDVSLLDKPLQTICGRQIDHFLRATVEEKLSDYFL